MVSCVLFYIAGFCTCHFCVSALFVSANAKNRYCKPPATVVQYYIEECDNLELSIINKDGKCLFSQKGDVISATYNGEYAEGDKIKISTPMSDYLFIQLDETLEKSFVFVPGSSMEFDDGSIATANFEKTVEGQKLVLDEAKLTKTVHLTNFKQAEYPFSRAALSRVEIYGKYIKEDYSEMEIRNAANPKDVKHYTTDRLREEFHISKLFTKDNVRMVYSHIDRIITAGFMPVLQVLKLEAGKELAADYFLQRREMGCINIGGKGIITVDGTEYEMNPRDGMYIGMGNKEITFKCVDPENPPKFYVSSCPAHKAYPTVKIDITKAKKVPCGSVEDCNKRTINQYIHPEVMQSCQLAMGLTQLEPGSNWNTMPSHTHDRRMEVYMYLDMGENDAVFHMMGEPNETRHIIMHNEEAVISPSWSIHSGVGTKAYSFIWAMCGENQEFDDMDHIETKDLR